MKFPYGISDFYKLITEDYFYLDRSDRIPLIEDAGVQLLFLRPRRFGKSLLLSMLENYYDIAKAEQFERLFGRLAIGRRPTPLHNRFLVMRWDFSAVASGRAGEEIEGALHRYLNSRIQDFAVRYHDLLPIPIQIEAVDALVSLQSLLTAVQQTPFKLYLFIDEYDNFANEILMSQQNGRSDRYDRFIHGEGLFKTVFKAIKAASVGQGLDRVFITGISPVVVSDLASGYNVARELTLNERFNDLCGFREEELEPVLQQMGAECGWPEGRVAEAMGEMRAFYNGYRFSPETEGLVYNPTLALYFLSELHERCRYPVNMLDHNLALDFGKVSFLSQLPSGGQLLLQALRADPPITMTSLSHRFGAERLRQTLADPDAVASLLYYFGVLTVGGFSRSGQLILSIPNQVVRRLYVERVQEMLLPEEHERKAGQEAAMTLYDRGDLQPLCDFLERRYFRAFDNRDYRWANELTVKTAFLTLLFNDTLYLVDSETELERSYADLTLIVRPEMRKYQLLDILIEFKYVGLDEAGLTQAQAQALSPAEVRGLAPVAAKLAEAGAKARRYETALVAKYGEVLRLRSYAVVALGFERVVGEEVVGDPKGLQDL